MRPIRVLCVPYLNALPLIEGLDKVRGIDVVYVPPARIAPMLEAGEADIGLASIIDVARYPLALLPVGMIGSDGPTLTVRLFSKVEPASITSVYADPESHTSVALCQVILRRVYNTDPTMVEHSASASASKSEPEGRISAEGGLKTQDSRLPEARLLIGDKVVTGAPEGYPHQLDLGLAWRELTGLPMVYAMWMCRADRADDPVIAHAAHALDRLRLRNSRRIEWILTRAAPRHGWPLPLARRYAKSLLRYDVGPREMQAVSTFLEAAAELTTGQSEPANCAGASAR